MRAYSHQGAVGNAWDNLKDTSLKAAVSQQQDAATIHFPGPVDSPGSSVPSGNNSNNANLHVLDGPFQMNNFGYVKLSTVRGRSATTESGYRSASELGAIHKQSIVFLPTADNTEPRGDRNIISSPAERDIDEGNSGQQPGPGKDRGSAHYRISASSLSPCLETDDIILGDVLAQSGPSHDDECISTEVNIASDAALDTTCLIHKAGTVRKDVDCTESTNCPQTASWGTQSAQSAPMTGNPGCRGAYIASSCPSSSSLSSLYLLLHSDPNGTFGIDGRDRSSADETSA